jgi:hypothetical protein
MAPEIRATSSRRQHMAGDPPRRREAGAAAQPG